ncbi:unnamed protein product [Sphacelaria rigidula]
MRHVNEGGMKSFDALDSSEKTMAKVGAKWWPQTAKQDGDQISKRFLCSVWTKGDGHLNVRGDPVRSRNAAAGLTLFHRHVEQVPMSSIRIMQHFAAPGRMKAQIRGEIDAYDDGLLKVSMDWFGKRLLVESVQEDLTKRDKVVRP